MIIRLQIIILVISLLHAPYLDAKGPDAKTIKLQNLLYIHNNILNENVQKNGKNLIDQTFQFLKDPKNKKLLQTPLGADLLRHQVMLGNYLAVKAHFEKCIKSKEAKRQLNTRVLDASFQSMKNSNIDISACRVFSKSSTNFATFNNQILKVMKASIAPDVKSTLNDTILANSARALLNLKYKFDPKFTGSAKDLASITQQFPAKSKNELSKVLENYALRVKATEKKSSAQEIQNGLNRSIDNLKINKTTQQLITEIQSPVGALLLTPTMKDRQKHIGLKDVQKIIRESENQIIDEKNDTIKENSTEALVKINPFATGEMLLAHPEYAGVICDAINKININDTDKEKRDRYFRIGTAILGGALILTGVGAVAGAYVITGSLTAGLVAGTVAGGIISTSTAVGVVAGLGGALYQGTNAYKSHREMVQLENAFITNNGDANNLKDAQNALENYKENRTAALIAVASAGLNVVNFSKLFSLAQLGSKSFKLSELKAVSSVMAAMSNSKFVLKLKGAIGAVGELTSTKIDTFLYRLAKTGEVTRLKILELLKNSRFTSKEMKEMVEDALAAAKNCI